MTRRFPAEVAEILTTAGWSPGRRDQDRGETYALQVAGYGSPDGRHHTVTPAALDAYAEFGGLVLTPTGEGIEIAPSTVDLDPRRAVHSVHTLAELGAILGRPLSPLGLENDGVGILAIDDDGRVFVLDHAGDWFLGESVDEALAALLLGRQPARVGEDGTW